MSDSSAGRLVSLASRACPKLGHSRTLAPGERLSVGRWSRATDEPDRDSKREGEEAEQA
jgi:hypothetical protein